MNFWISSLEVFDNRVETRLKLSVDWPAGAEISGEDVSIWDIDEWQTYVLLQSWRDYDPADPHLRVRWQLRRGDTNAILEDVHHLPATPIDTSHTFKVHFAKYGVGHENLNLFKLSVRVYRLAANGPHDYVYLTINIHILDRLDRSHPYVQWQYAVPTPNVVHYDDGTSERVGWRMTQRKSVLHRTRMPGRCRFAEEYSWMATAKETLKLEYLDELPFQVEYLAAHRKSVCDYCFYGGPSKTEPKIGPAKIEPAPA